MPERPTYRITFADGPLAGKTIPVQRYHTTYNYPDPSTLQVTRYVIWPCYFTGGRLDPERLYGTVEDGEMHQLRLAASRAWAKPLLDKMLADAERGVMDLWRDEEAPERARLHYLGELEQQEHGDENAAHSEE